MEKYSKEVPPYARAYKGRLNVIINSLAEVLPTLDSTCIKGTFPLLNKNVLDFGCYQGDFVYSLARCGANVIGIDNDSAALAVASTRCSGLSNVTFVTGDALKVVDNLPEVDVTLCLSLLHHLLSDKSFYKGVFKSRNSPESVSGSGPPAVFAFMRKLRRKTKVLFLEMGTLKEPRIWASGLPYAALHKDRLYANHAEYLYKTWILTNLLHNVGFVNVREFKSPEVSGFQKLLHGHYNLVVKTPEYIQKFLGFDNRNSRPLFMAW